MDHPRTRHGENQNEPRKDMKRAYEKPAIIYSAPLEALAGACGTYPTTGKTSFIDCSNKPNRS
jgi:hypothetical protein